MYTWAIVDEFGFVIKKDFTNKEDAEKTRIKIENDPHSKLFDIKYELKKMPA